MNLQSTADTGTGLSADREGARRLPQAPVGVAPSCQQPKQAPLVRTQLETGP